MLLICSQWDWGTSRAREDHCLESDIEEEEIEFLGWYADILFPFPSYIIASSSSSGTHFSPNIIVFIQIDSSGFSFSLFPISLSSFLSQFLAKDKLLGIFILNLNDSLRSEVVRFTNSEALLVLSGCCIDGGRGNSFVDISMLFPSIDVFSNFVVSVRGCSCDMNIVAFVVFLSVVVSSSVFDIGVVGGGANFLLRNRTLHRVVIMAMLVANPIRENEKYRNGPINELVALS